MSSCCHKINGRIPCPAKVEHTIGGKTYCRHHVPYSEQRHASKPIQPIDKVECNDELRKKAEKLVRQRVLHQCQGTAKSTGKQCRQNAKVGSTLCSLHGGPLVGPGRYIPPDEFLVVVEDLLRMAIELGVTK